MLTNYLNYSSGARVAIRFGKVTRFIGMVIEVKGISAAIGEYCKIVSNITGRKILAEVVGFKDQSLLLMPFEKGRGISLGDLVETTNHNANIGASDELIGHVIDPFCQPLDTDLKFSKGESLDIYPQPTNPMRKQLIDQKISTGIKAIDHFVPLGRGQRVGLFAGSGVGKTTLIKMLTRGVKSDLKIIVLIGERGREVAEFVRSLKQSHSKQDFIVVVAASDQPPLTRIHSIFTATALAEYFSEQGRDVLLVVDSITRFAMAQRELGLAIGEPPTSKGYTPSVFSQIPLLLERVGNYQGRGSITGLYTVLVEGDDLDEPIADHMRSVLDGHIVLTRELAEQNVYPPIDILKSNSRVASSIISRDRLSENSKIVKYYAKYRAIRDLVELGIYSKGKDKDNDNVLEVKEVVDRFITQSESDPHFDDSSRESLNHLLENLN